MRTLKGLRGVILAAASLLAAPSLLYAAAQITKGSGIVQIQPSGSGAWKGADKFPYALNPGDQVRTGAGARATVTFTDGSRVELGSDAAFTLEEASSNSSMRLNFGRMKAFVTKLLSRRFEVRTPTAVCSVRGTEFSVDVAAGGRTTVDLYEGLLGVGDNKGNSILLKEGESVSVDLRGLSVPEKLQGAAESRQQGSREEARREVSLDMSKDDVLAAAAREVKLAEYQQGKSLIDVSGNRVRVEEYIMRPQSNQFKLVVLNERQERFDYFYYLGTFNTSLPTDLSSALRQLGGRVDTAPDYYLTAFETGRSNTVDSIRELANGGHLVDVNNNNDGNDDVDYFFNAATDQYESVSGRSVYQTLYDNYGFYLNSKLKYGWTGSSIDSYLDITAATNADPISGAPLTTANAYVDGSGYLYTRSFPSITWPDSDKIHQQFYESYADGSFLQFDNYIINDEGQIARVSDFAGLTTGDGFKKKLLDYNYQQVITATEFGGRKIDLVVSPKVLIQSGLIQ